MTAERLVIVVAFVFLSVSLAAGSDAQAQRIYFAYEKPQNPAHQSLYEFVKERHVLERLQEIFGPFRLPSDLTFKTVGCDGRSNAWYEGSSVTLCYEYLEEIRKNIPQETTPAGITPVDALVGQFFYVAAHEFGHAVFNLLKIPSFGSEEDAADQFAAYIMLQLGKDEARRLISGAAYSYKGHMEKLTMIVPLKAFSDVHGMPAQRFYNLLCVAYGADPEVFAYIVTEKYLPAERAARCKHEYDQVAFAFRQLVSPHIDPELAKMVLDKAWLPDARMLNDRN